MSPQLCPQCTSTSALWSQRESQGQYWKYEASQNTKTIDPATSSFSTLVLPPRSSNLESAWRRRIWKKMKKGRHLQHFLTTVTSCIQGPTHSWTFARKRLQAMSLFGPSAPTTKLNIRVLQWIIMRYSNNMELITRMFPGNLDCTHFPDLGEFNGFPLPSPWVQQTMTTLHETLRFYLHSFTYSQAEVSISHCKIISYMFICSPA